jgi:hypothetical protein
MFVRRHRKIVSGESYEYWTLCESRRTAAGPRQRVVATLGKLTDEEPLDEAGWEQLDALLDGKSIPRQMQLGQQLVTTAPGPRWELVEEIATVKSIDVVLPVRRGDTVAQLRLRCVSRPERRVAELLVRLGLELPNRSRILEDFPVEGSQNVVQKTTP